MSDTLVLDTLGFPVAFVSWQRAVNLQWQERAVVVTEDAKRVLRSPSFEMGMPRVIKLRNHIGRNGRTTRRTFIGMSSWKNSSPVSKRGRCDGLKSHRVPFDSGTGDQPFWPRLKVGRLTLNQLILVRFQGPEPLRDRSIGRTPHHRSHRPRRTRPVERRCRGLRLYPVRVM